MKLKKIASLALAGVMAVSMLAACGTDANTNTNTNTETSTSNDLAAYMDEFDTTGVDIKFTNDSKLSDAVKQVLTVYGASEYMTDGQENGDIFTAVKKVGGFKDVIPETSSKAGLTWGNHFVGSNATYAGTKEKEAGDLDGKTYTTYGMYVVKATNAEMAMNWFATNFNKAVTTPGSVSLSTKSADAVTVGNNKYYKYSYTCPVGMASAKDSDGETVYYFLYEMNQTVSAASIG